MKLTQKPVMFTIIFGMIAGVTFIPATMILSNFVYWPRAFNIVVWFFLATYGCCLARWGNTRLIPVLFPLLLLFVVSVKGMPMSLFLLLTLGIFTWIRSGICLNGPWAKVLFAEIATSIGGGILVACFAPNSSSSWAIGIFLFFLVQSLYFLIIGNTDKEFKANTPTDHFDNARKEAEKILMQRI